MPKIRMIASDLDGTFLDSQGLASPENVSAMLEAADRGVHLVFATGRPARWLQALDPVLGARPQAITSNGAVVFDIVDKVVLHHSPMPSETTIAVADDLRAAMPDVAFAVEYTNGWGREIRYPLRGDKVEAKVLAQSVPELLASGTAVKLLAISPSLHTHDMAEIAEPVNAERLAGTFSMVRASGLLEFCAPGVSKASALELLMDDLGVAPAELVAFGDMPNDLSMLHLAGHAYAMADAHPLLLEHGFARAGGHDDSGVGRTVRELLDAGLI